MGWRLKDNFRISSFGANIFLSALLAHFLFLFFLVLIAFIAF
jgi:hypothetical protein